MTDTALNRAGLDESDDFVVRHVLLPSRTEWHAESCGCRVPKGAEVVHSIKSPGVVLDVHAEAVDLNDGPSPIKPCLREIAEAAIR